MVRRVLYEIRQAWRAPREVRAARGCVGTRLHCLAIVSPQTLVRSQGVKDDDGEVLPPPDTLRGRSLQTIMDKASGEDMGNPKFKELRPVRCVLNWAVGGAEFACWCLAKLAAVLTSERRVSSVPRHSLCWTAWQSW